MVHASGRKHNPWLWIPSLCATEEIPSAVVTYVALIMFLQFGASEPLASVYAASLFIPWVLKSVLYTRAVMVKSVTRRIHVVELLMFACLMLIALCLEQYRVGHLLLFFMMFMLSHLCAWHELFSRLYYGKMLMPRQQKLFRNTKMAASYVSLIMTYGLLIIVAGFFEVFFRSYQKAWAMESTIVAGAFFTVAVVNTVVLKSPLKKVQEAQVVEKHNVGHLFESLGRFGSMPHFPGLATCLFFLLLPQSLLFNTRVFFLFAPEEAGGLGCSVQDVGYAQGTIGVVAFAVGVSLGRWFMLRGKAVARFDVASVVLTLSPVAYMLMAIWRRPGDISLICCMTFFAQFCLGFGLNACNAFVTYFSGRRYRNTTNFLYIPVVAAVMIVPMALSGMLCLWMGYKDFFVMCSLMAPVAWVMMWALKVHEALFADGKDARGDNTALPKEDRCAAIRKDMMPGK